MLLPVSALAVRAGIPSPKVLSLNPSHLAGLLAIYLILNVLLEPLAEAKSSQASR